MSKHHHQREEERTNNRLQAAIRSNRDTAASLKSKPASLKRAPSKAGSEDDPVRTLAYQLHQQKGGPALDNWLEAAQILKNNHQAVSGFLNEGNPNTKNISER